MIKYKYKMKKEIYGSIAQSVEQASVKREVVGSSPTVPAIYRGVRNYCKTLVDDPTTTYDC